MSQQFASLTDFYASHEDRLASAEIDVGLSWRDGVHGPTYRAAWVQKTGELYALRHASPLDGGGVVRLLGRFADEAALEAALRGYQHVCGEAHSFAWLQARVAGQLPLDLAA